MSGRFLYPAFAVTLMLFALSITAVAQDLDDVTVTGRLSDSNGLAVVGGSVTATSVETGEARTVVTGDEGRYRIINLKPGTYKIKASANGFGTQETPAIATISAQNVTMDFKLAPAGVTAEQTITVNDNDGPAVDTTRTIVGGTITEREIEEIPNNAQIDHLDISLHIAQTDARRRVVGRVQGDFVAGLCGVIYVANHRSILHCL